MNRPIRASLGFAILACLSLAAIAEAHFVYIVPVEGGKSIQVVFSDDLAPDSSVPVTKAANTKLTLRSGGKDAPLKTQKDENAYKAEVGGKGIRIVFGVTDYGVITGKGKAFRLYYHPKTVIGDAFSQEAKLGKAAAVEIVPVKDGAKVKFLVLAGGKPLPDAEVFLRKPGAEKSETVKTDATGYTPACAETGRYAVVAKKLTATPGEQTGKKYEEERHYATLVVDIATAK